MIDMLIRRHPVVAAVLFEIVVMTFVLALGGPSWAAFGFGLCAYMAVRR